MVASLRRIAIALPLALVVACATAGRRPPDEILGIKLGMSRQAVRTTLASVATFQREESKRHEIWSAAGPRYRSLIIGYDPAWKVRFVTAIANLESEPPLRYADVLDVATATRQQAGEHVTYTWTSPASSYQIIAIGNLERVEYYSLKKTGESEEEEEDDD